jgi:c-di-GMP-related signal transduction protein
MEPTQNITLTIPKNVLRKAKILAIQKNTSLSGLLTETLVEMVRGQEAYEQARQRGMAWLEGAFDLGTHGQTNWKREHLHER